MLRIFGISRIPGIGCPVVMSSTICAKEVGYEASISSGTRVVETESTTCCDRVGSGVLLGTFSLLTVGFVISMDW